MISDAKFVERPLLVPVKINGLRFDIETIVEAKNPFASDVLDEESRSGPTFWGPASRREFNCKAVRARNWYSDNRREAQCGGNGSIDRGIVRPVHLTLDHYRAFHRNRCVSPGWPIRP
jgi:hypothetical protein